MVSCSEDKYLDIYPLTSITEGNFYQSEAELHQALNDVYRQLGRIYSANGIADLYGEQTSDNTRIIMKSGADNWSEQINEFWTLTDNGRLRAAWDECYNAIYICNNIIHQLQNPEVDIGTSVQNRMIAEALLVRSLIYFNMVRAWGDIPLVTKPIAPVEAYDYLRVGVDEVYHQIISDLIFARDHLPANYTGVDVGRVTRYGAAGILAKIYMTLGNNPVARTELEFIINSGLFSLDANNDGVIDFEDYLYVFHPNTKNSRSSILEVQYRAGVNAVNSNHQNVYTPFSHAFNLVDLGVPASIFRGSGINTPTVDLENVYESNDPRKDASIYPGFTNQATGEFVEYPFTIKYFDPNWTNPGSNLTIIRYADVLLMYAEVTEDASYLNMVRDRVGLPHFGSDDYPDHLYPTLQLAIEHERRVELAFEFHRFFDLVRTGRAIEVMQAKGYSNINQNRLLFPIPQHVIDVNPQITQNPGY